MRSFKIGTRGSRLALWQSSQVASALRKMGYKVEATDLLGVTDYVRHDSSKLNEAIIRVIETYRVIRR